MNYKKIYEQIIYDPRNHLLKKGEYEKHHIVPKSLGGNESDSNLVKLSFKKHFICHKLLVLMHEKSTSQRHKMSFALKRMSTSKSKNMYLISSNDYSFLRREHVLSLRGNKLGLGYKHTEKYKKEQSQRLTGNKNGRGWSPSIEQREKISKTHKGTKKPRNKEWQEKINASNRGKKLSDEHYSALCLANIGRKRTVEQNENNRKAQNNPVIKEKNRLSQLKRHARRRQELGKPPKTDDWMYL